ncbi:MAG: IS21-like element helper ATPase IstB [Sandaracinaceae bacterium]
MLNEQTLQKLHVMRLAAMATAWQEQQKDTRAGKLSFDERLSMLVDAEYLARDNRRLERLLKNADLRFADACLENVEASTKRGLPRATLTQLTSGVWLAEHLNVLISGKTGVGKSYLACALGQFACRRGLHVLYRRLPRLFNELALAKADGTYQRRLAKLAKIDVLVLDDLGLGTGLKEAQRHDLLEVMEDRYGKTCTVVTSQLDPNLWHEWIGDPTVADAILDRLVHNAYKLSLTGPSRRKEDADKTTT